MSKFLKNAVAFALMYFVIQILFNIVLVTITGQKNLLLELYLPVLIAFAMLYSLFFHANFTNQFKSQASQYITLFSFAVYFADLAIHHFYFNQPIETFVNEIIPSGLVVTVPPIIKTIFVIALYIFGASVFYIINYYLIYLGNRMALIFMKHKNLTQL